MDIKYQNLSLDQLKAQKKVIESRIALTKCNLTPKQQTASPTLLALVREDVALAHLIANWTPHDFTPNPGGTSGTPTAALAHA